MSKRDFLALEDWNTSDIERLLTLAARVKRGEVTGGLEQRVLGLMLLTAADSPASFEVAMYLHGGTAVTMELGENGTGVDAEFGMEGAGEAHITDAARVHGRYCDALCVRAVPAT